MVQSLFHFEEGRYSFISTYGSLDCSRLRVAGVGEFQGTPTSQLSRRSSLSSLMVVFEESCRSDSVGVKHTDVGGR